MYLFGISYVYKLIINIINIHICKRIMYVCVFECVLKNWRFIPLFSWISYQWASISSLGCLTGWSSFLISPALLNRIQLSNQVKGLIFYWWNGRPDTVFRRQQIGSCSWTIWECDFIKLFLMYPSNILFSSQYMKIFSGACFSEIRGYYKNVFIPKHITFTV